MLTFCSFLQNVYHFVKALVINVSKKMYRSAAVLTSGFAVVTVITLTSSGFGGGGKNALTAFAETPPSQGEAPEEDLDLEENEFITEAKIQIGLTDSRKQGQQLVGSLLTKNVHRKQQVLLDTKAEIEKLNKETVMQQMQQLEEEKKAAEQQAHMIPASSYAYSEEDYQVLLRIVQAEAGICDQNGKIMVANVILNRVRDSEFPNNITDVVYQRSQFSPVSNGAINRVKVTQETIDCVNRALSGEDYSQGALFFMYRGGSRSHAVNWFDRNLTFLFKHGNHEFFR